MTLSGARLSGALGEPDAVSADKSGREREEPEVWKERRGSARELFI